MFPQGEGGDKNFFSLFLLQRRPHFVHRESLETGEEEEERSRREDGRTKKSTFPSPLHSFFLSPFSSTDAAAKSPTQKEEEKEEEGGKKIVGRLGRRREEGERCAKKRDSLPLLTLEIFALDPLLLLLLFLPLLLSFT